MPDAIASDDLWFGCQDIQVPTEAEALEAADSLRSSSGVRVFSADTATHLKLVALGLALRYYKRQSFSVVDMSNPTPEFLNDLAPPELFSPVHQGFSSRALGKAVSRVRTTGFLIVLNVDIPPEEDAIILSEAIKRRAIHTRGSMSYLTVFTSVIEVCPQLRSLVCKSSTRT